MLKRFLAIALLALPLGLFAQTKFGYLSYNAVYEAMPDYQSAKESMAALQAKYDAETGRSEEEFNKKFGEFLQGQKDFPANILQKRQKELQELMDKSLAFKKETQQALEQAEKDLQKPVLDKLNAAIAAVGKEHGYAYIINIDGNACPFINPANGEDATAFVLGKMQLPAAPAQPVTPAAPAQPAAPATPVQPAQ